MKKSAIGLIALTMLAAIACYRGPDQEKPSPSPSPSPTAVSSVSSSEKRMTNENLQDLVTSFGGLDGIELKMTIDDSERQSVVKALEMDPLDAEMRQVIFFDTNDLALNHAGVVVRARRIKGEDGDSVIKLRPVQPSQATPKLRAIPSFKVELDALPSGYVCSASFEHDDIDDEDIKAVVAQKKPIRDLFTEEQRAFFAEHAPKGVSLDSLRVLGPINVLKLKFTPTGLNRKLVAEQWNYPDGSRILELSTTCKPEEAAVVAKETIAYLSSKGVKPGTAQQTKTRAALEYYTKGQ